MNTIDSLPKKHLNKISSVDDERQNGDGWWIYLKAGYADFEFDPQSPTTQIHEQNLTVAIRRLKRDVRLITEADYAKFEMLERKIV